MKKLLLGLIIAIALALCLNSIFALHSNESEEFEESKVDIILVNETRTIASVAFRQHGNITASNSTLILRDATLEMVQDSFTKRYYISFDNSSKFIIEHSTLTSGKYQFCPLLKLNVTLRNTTVSIRNSTIAFPGSIWFENCAVEIYNSKFTNLDPSGTGLDIDDNNDCPFLTFTNSNITIADSKIEHYYEAFLGEQAFTSIPSNRTFQPGDNDSFEFSPSGINIVTQYLSAVVLQVTYTGEEWYNGTSSVLWSKDGIEYVNTTIEPKNKTATESYELFTSGIRTIGELERIRVKFENNDLENDTKSNVTFHSVKLVFSYENDISLTNSTLHAINTYMDLDFRVGDTDPTGNVQETTPETYFIDASLTHNVLRAKFNSKVYLYNVTVDSSETGGIPYKGNPPFISDSTSQILFYKWLEIRTTDLPGMPIDNVELIIESNATLVTPPPAVILQYLGRDLSNYNRTLAGKATIPLLSDLMLPSKWPNSEFVGNYNITARYQTYSKLRNASFKYFPLIEAEHNTELVVISFEELVPDFTITKLATAEPLIEGEVIKINVKVNNFGTTSGYSVNLKLLDNGELFHEEDIAHIPTNGAVELYIDWTATATVPSEVHNITAIVDELNRTPELDEGNNIAWVHVIVLSRPDLYIESISFSDCYPIENDIITIFGTIGNLGETSASYEAEFYVDNTLLAKSSFYISANTTANISSSFNTSNIYGKVNVTVKLTNCTPSERILTNNELTTSLLIYSAKRGDLVLESDRTIEHDYLWPSNIVIRGCNLLISNSTLTIPQTFDWENEMIALQGAGIVLHNSTIKSNYQLCMHVYDGNLSVTNSTLNLNVITKGSTNIFSTGSLFNGSLNITCDELVTESTNFASKNILVNANSIYIENSVLNSPSISLQAQKSRIQNTSLASKLVFEHGIIELINVTAPAEVLGNATLYRYWWLKVNFIDKLGSGIPDAEIRIYSREKESYIQILGMNRTDENGIALVRLLAEELTAKGVIHTKNYILNLSYGNESFYQYFSLENNTELKKDYQQIVVVPTALELTAKLSTEIIEAGGLLIMSGTVRYNLSTKPGVANALVTITIDHITYSTNTDANGKYEKEIAAPGTGGNYGIAVSVTDPHFNLQAITEKSLVVLAPPPKPFDILPVIVAIVIVVIVIAICFVMRKKLKAYLVILKAKLKKEEFTECSECSKKIPSSLRKCVFCGVEFEEAKEEELAKCSECGAFVPITAKKCPKCGAVFKE